MSRVAVVFGQFGAAADPVNLPIFQRRLEAAGVTTILIQHTDTQRCMDFLRGYPGPKGIIGSSLGAGASPLFAAYLREAVDFVGGFQPSDWDPALHTVAAIKSGLDIITRAAIVPKTVKAALCFRNPILAGTGGLGHGTYIAEDPDATKLQVIERADVHPGDFPPAQDTMVEQALGALK